MGYYSTYSGEYKPTRVLTKDETDIISEWFRGRFGGYSIDNDGKLTLYRVNDDGEKVWYYGNIVFNPKSQTVYPTSEYMKGYDLNQHIYEFVTMLKSRLPGVEYEGEVERTGEDFGDCELVKIENMKVMSCSGRIRYDSPVEVCETEADKNARFRAEFEKMKKEIVR